MRSRLQSKFGWYRALNETERLSVRNYAGSLAGALGSTIALANGFEVVFFTILLGFFGTLFVLSAVLDLVLLVQLRRRIEQQDAWLRTLMQSRMQKEEN